ncbi:MAG: hypothetical protein IJ326_05425 [Lachnospiraceae bacterium]|nr:hypothetical protein [Lachnospiraceae bacterium]
MLYDTRVKGYAKGVQVTMYSKTFEKSETQEEKKINEKFTKAFQNENRTEESAKDCMRISINQTKNRIYDIARSNDWSWFFTLTFDRKKVDSSDYDEVVKKFTKCLNNLRERVCPDVKYLFVPELHADGKHYHFHGIASDCDELQFSFSGKFDKKSGLPIYNVRNWAWGYSTATQVQDTQRVSSYITKYITKECVGILKNKKRYYASQNVLRPAINYTLCTQDEFLEQFASEISHCKTITVPQAHLQVTYYELDNI